MVGSASGAAEVDSHASIGDMAMPMGLGIRSRGLGEDRITFLRALAPILRIKLAQLQDGGGRTALTINQERRARTNLSMRGLFGEQKTRVPLVSLPAPLTKRVSLA